MAFHRRSYSDADSAADLATYYKLKRSVAGRSLLVVTVIALLVLPWSWYASLALAVGVFCGTANMLAIMRGSERLVESRSAVLFALSSLLRLTAFSIVAAALVARGPWWSLGPFLAGFFFPLATYALSAPRAFQTKQ
ncbi:MAG: hypothetical protein WA814_06850 [Candidatus Baltobacteraceae bacterium]